MSLAGAGERKNPPVRPLRKRLPSPCERSIQVEAGGFVAATVEAGGAVVNERYPLAVDSPVDILGTSGSVAVDGPGIGLWVLGRGSRR